MPLWHEELTLIVTDRKDENVLAEEPQGQITRYESQCTSSCVVCLEVVGAIC